MDDTELAAALGLIDVPPEPPAYAGFDPALAMAITDPRARFDQCADCVKRLDAESLAFRHKLRAEYVAGMESLWKAHRGRKKFSLSTAEVEFAAIAKERVAIARGQITAYSLGITKAKDLLTTAMQRAADVLPIRDGPERVIYRTVSDSSYSTQTNPKHYAEVRAKLFEADLCVIGVRFGTDRTPDGDLCVHTHIHGDDAPLLPFKTGVKFSEYVRIACQYGANPRVFWSFLPHGYEEEHGFDSFGCPFPLPNKTHPIFDSEVLAEPEPEPEPL